VVEDKNRTLLRGVARSTLYGIHSIFPPPEVTKHKSGKDSVSIKKLEKGDAKFMTLKVVLGFLLDGKGRTVRLSQDKAGRICLELTWLLKNNQIPLKRFLSRSVGKISNATRILLAAKGLLTPLFWALWGDPKMIGLGKDSELRGALTGIHKIIQSLGERATYVDELVRNSRRIIQGSRMHMVRFLPSNGVVGTLAGRYPATVQNGEHHQQ
jgi:hypothetical protein